MVLVGIFLIVIASIVIGVKIKKNKARELINPVVLKYQDQAQEYEKKVKKEPKDPDVLRKYAVALYATGRLDESIEIYNQEMEINPNDAVLFNNLANIYRDKRDNNQAETYYKRSIDIKNTDNPAYINLAGLYWNQMGDKAKAVEVYENLLKNEPTNEVAKIKLNDLKNQ